MTQQHTTPCAQCPFRRASISGWLGGIRVERFIEMAMSELIMPCHTVPACRDGVRYGDPKNVELPQCAGRAIFWANQAKLPINRLLVQLPSDLALVFQWRGEFIAHHSGVRESRARAARPAIPRFAEPDPLLDKTR